MFHFTVIVHIWGAVVLLWHVIKLRKDEKKSYARRLCIGFQRGIIRRVPWCKDYPLFHLAVLCDTLRCGAYGTFCYGIS